MMSNVYEHPTLAVNIGIKAAEAEGSLLDVVLAIEACWNSDLEPKGLRQALTTCRQLNVDAKSASRFYRLLCLINPVWNTSKTYTASDLRNLQAQLVDTIENARPRGDTDPANVSDEFMDSLTEALKRHHIKSELQAAAFQLYERERYHHFWPATEIADILERLFAPSDDPGRIIGSYLRAMFDGPDPADDTLGIFFRTGSPKHANSILAVTRQVAVIVCSSESIDQEEKEALEALIGGEAFGGYIDDRNDGRLAALRLARAAAGVSKQNLFTALAKEAIGASYLDVDSPTQEDKLVALALMVSFFVGTCSGFDRRQLDALFQHAEVYRSRNLAGASPEFLVWEEQSWRRTIEQIRSQVTHGGKRRPRFAPQLILSFLNWKNVAIAEIVRDESWFFEDVLPKHMVAAERYSTSEFAGRAYFSWEDSVEPCVVHETALRAEQTQSWSISTLIAFIQSGTFHEAYRGLFVNQLHGYGEFERELVRRSEASGFPGLAAAFTSFFVFDHVRRVGHLPELLKWSTLIQRSLETRWRNVVCFSIGYAAQLARMRGNELNALALLDLIPMDAQPVTQPATHIGPTAIVSDYQGAIESIRQILNGVDPRSVLDDESLHQWVDAYRIEAVVRSHVGAAGLISWVGPGHGYHAAMESTLRNRLSKVYFDAAYKEWKESIGESREWKNKPSWDHLLKLLRDAKRSENISEMLDSITALHHHPKIIGRLEHLNQQFRTKTAHGKNFSQKDMGAVLDILFGNDSLFRDVVLNLRPKPPN